MKSVVGIYQTNDDAVAAVDQLNKAGYETKLVSLLAKADMVNDHISIPSTGTRESTELGIGAVAGSILGLLTGVSIIALPGLGFLYGAGALVGAFAGFDIGIIGGGFVAILTSVGMKEELAGRYEQYLKEGKFLVLVQGNDEELEHAHHVLHNNAKHMGLDKNF